jgi:hypothetical protein
MPKYNIPTREEVEAAQQEVEALCARLLQAEKTLNQSELGTPLRAAQQVTADHLARLHRLAKFKADELKADFVCFSRMRRGDRADMFETLLAELKLAHGKINQDLGLDEWIGRQAVIEKAEELL